MHKSGYIYIDGTRVRIRTIGEGTKKIIMIPGWPFSSTIYLLLTDVIRDVQIISFDLPGWSGQTTVTTKVLPSFNTYLALCDKITKQLMVKEGPCFIGGVSVGGLMALMLCKTNPNFKGCFVQSPACNGLAVAKNHKVELFFMRLSVFFPFIGIGLKWFYIFNYKRIQKNIGTMLSKEISSELLADFINLDPKSVLSFAFSFFKYDFTSQLSGITIPTRIVGCCADTAVNISDTRMLCINLPGCDYIEITYGQHYLLMQDPKTFASLLLEFIDRSLDIQ